MTLEQALHQRWSDNQTLNALLPADRVTTGRSSLGTLPRATICRESRCTVCRTNLGDILEDVTVTMHLRHESFDDGIAIIRQFLAVFDRSHFNLSENAKVLSLRRIEDTCRQANDNTWQFQTQLLARVLTTP